MVKSERKPNRFSFTVSGLERLAPPEKGRSYYYDTKVPQLGVTITPTGSKSFHVRATVHHHTKRISIEGGKYPAMKIEQARRKALDMLSLIAEGYDPVERRREKKFSDVTLASVLETYFARKRLKQGTIDTYRKNLRSSFGDYLERPLRLITQKVIVDVNTHRGNKAASAMRVLRALFNFARYEYKAGDESFFPNNPLDILTEQRIGHKYGRKKTYIKSEEFPYWFDAVEALDTVEKEYFLFLLFTGVRADTEAATLEWQRINWRTLTFHLIDTKNGEDVELPLPRYLVGLLKKRMRDTGYVFPIKNEARSARQQVIQQSDVKFTRHDLRRTFLAIGESEDISFLALKRLANHLSQEHDVTAGYIPMNLERLRKASNQIESAILKYAGRLKPELVLIHG